MKIRERKGTTRVAVAAAALCVAVGAFAAPGRAMDVEIQVATADGKKFAGTLYAGEQALPVDSANAKLKVRNLEDRRRIAVAADLKVADEKGKPPLRYLGVVEVFPGRGPVQVTAQRVKDIDLFCSGCHPSDKQPIKEGQIVRDVHASGKELTGRYLVQNGKFKEFIEKIRKEGKERPPEPVLLEERIVVVDGKEVKKYYSTCESCHTLHWKTPWTKYARAAFVDMGTLCAGCHY
jgi:hypothetical protein